MNNTGTFAAVNDASAVLSLAPGEDAEIVLTLTGSHAYRVDLERMASGDLATEHLVSFTADTPSTRWKNATPDVVRLRLQCELLTATETVAYTLRDTVPHEAREIICTVAVADVGAPGWAISSGDVPTGALPASKTAAILFVKLIGLEVGDRIVGAYLSGNLIASGGESATIRFSLSYAVAAIAGETTFLVAETDDLVVLANTLLSKANTQVQVDHTVASGEIAFAQIVGTTGAGCTAEVDALVLQVIRG